VEEGPAVVDVPQEVPDVEQEEGRPEDEEDDGQRGHRGPARAEVVPVGLHEEPLVRERHPRGGAVDEAEVVVPRRALGRGRPGVRVRLRREVHRPLDVRAPVLGAEAREELGPVHHPAQAPRVHRHPPRRRAVLDAEGPVAAAPAPVVEHVQGGGARAHVEHHLVVGLQVRDVLGVQRQLRPRAFPEPERLEEASVVRVHAGPRVDVHGRRGPREGEGGGEEQGQERPHAPLPPGGRHGAKAPVLAAAAGGGGRGAARGGPRGTRGDSPARRAPRGPAGSEGTGGNTRRNENARSRRARRWGRRQWRGRNRPQTSNVGRAQAARQRDPVSRLTDTLFTGLSATRRGYLLSQSCSGAQGA